MTPKSITPAALYDRMRAGESVHLIDVRSPGEYQEVHAEGARSVPLDALSKEHVLTGASGNGERPVYVICWSGARSASACDRLIEQGLRNVVNVDGGTQAWQKAGLPVERSDGGGSRNWLRVGGLLGVTVSLILGLTVSPGFMFAAAGIWLVLVLTGNGPCCSSGTCSTGRDR